MKTIKPVLLCLALLLINNTLHAQFMKKLEKRVKAATEEAVLRKTEQEAAKQTEKTIDAILQTPNRKNENSNNQSMSANGSKAVATDEKMLEDYLKQQEGISLPESFSFEWKYVLKLESEAYKEKQKQMGDTKMTYFLSTQSTAFATQFELGKEDMGMGNTLMVKDPSTGLNVMLMEVDGEKVLQNMPSTNAVPNEDDEANDYLEDASIKKIGTKKILGFTCQGFEIKIKEGVNTVYINPNAPVRFNNSQDPNYAPKGFDEQWLKEFENGLMMEMTFVSSEKAKHNMKMTCVELVKQPFRIYTSEYKSFMEMDKD